MAWIVDRWKKLVRLYTKEIWQPTVMRDHSPRGWVYAGLRVLSITWTGFNETKAASRAAALSYSSLLGLGPLIAIAILVAGFVLDSKDPHLAANALNRVIKFVAPQVAQDQQPSAPSTDDRAVPAATTSTVKPVIPVKVNPELVDLINGIISGSRSGAAGATGALSLILIVLLLFTSVENTFNEIWGVRRGRSWLTRIVLYWTIVTLGAVLFFASLTGLGAGTFVNFFKDF